MGRRPLQLIDMVIKRPKYIKYAIAINDLIPWLKEQIEVADLNTIRILKEELANEVEIEEKEVESIAFYQNLKFVLLVHGIVLKQGIHESGKKLFTMRRGTYRDRMPKYWRRRSRLFKQLMKSKEWESLLKQNNKKQE